MIGYYTLTSESLGRDLIPEKFIKKVPANYNAPVVLLGSMAQFWAMAKMLSLNKSH